MTRPQILVAAPMPIFPTTDGGRIHNARHLEALADVVDYHLLAIVNQQERADFDYDAHDEFFATVTLVDRPPLLPDLGAGAAWRRFWFHIRRGLPLVSVSYYSDEAVRQARRIVEEHGIELLETLGAHAAFFARFLEVPAVLVAHNIEGDLHPFWAGRRSIPARAMWKLLGRLSARTTQRVELGNSLGFADRLYISEADAARASPPNGVLGPIAHIDHHERRFLPDRLDVLTLGSHEWPPNAEGVRWLLSEVWPLVTASQARLNIVGASPPADVIEAASDRIAVHGFVEDVAAWRREADVLAVPLLRGSGVRLKIIEALGSGLPVVTTSKGAEGLHLVDEDTALIADTATDFAASIDRLAEAPHLRRHLSGLGRKRAEEAHSMGTAADTKRTMYERVLGRRLDAS